MASVASVCTCGAVTLGPIHRKLMRIHQKIMTRQEVFNDEYLAIKVGIGKRYFPNPDVQPSANLGIFHHAIQFRRSVTQDFVAMKEEEREHSEIIASLFDRVGDFNATAAAPLSIKSITDANPIYVRNTGNKLWAICLNCDWKMSGTASSNFGSWHACGTRHRVAYSGSKFDKAISLIPVPMRRAHTYRKNFRQQQRMPCDIDPYGHPYFKYGVTPKSITEGYKLWMRRYCRGERLFPEKPWVDPYEQEYREAREHARL